jgi:membrane-associated phospholipid phosphatase
MTTYFYEAGINFTLYLQSLGDWLVPVMLFFTYLGNEEFFLLFMPILYWCLDAKLGIRMGVLLMITNGVGLIFKSAFHSPRPYWISSEVTAYTSESSFGVPSGHAMNAAAFWGLLAASLKKTWVWVLMLGTVFLIGFSRLYLGVHYLLDVIVGWLLGFLLLWIFLQLEKPAVTWLRSQKLAVQYLIVFAASLSFVLVAWLVKISLGDWQVPADWVANAAAAFPREEPINPLSLEGLMTVVGVIFGLGAGTIWIAERGGFDTNGVWWRRALRYPLGLVGVIILWAGLGAVFPDGANLLAYSLRYLRYALIGFWIAGLAPLVFIKLKLADAGK